MLRRKEKIFLVACIFIAAVLMYLFMYGIKVV